MMAPIYLLVTLLDAGASSNSLEWWPAACWWSCTPSVLPFITLNFYCTPVEWLAGWSGGKSWLAEEFCIKTSTMVWSTLWAREVLKPDLEESSTWGAGPLNLLCVGWGQIYHSSLLSVLWIRRSGCRLLKKEALLQSTSDTCIACGETSVQLANHICQRQGAWVSL